MSRKDSLVAGRPSVVEERQKRPPTSRKDSLVAGRPASSRHLQKKAKKDHRKAWCRRRKAKKDHQRVVKTRWWQEGPTSWKKGEKRPPTSRKDSLVAGRPGIVEERWKKSTNESQRLVGDIRARRRRRKAKKKDHQRVFTTHWWQEGPASSKKGENNPPTSHRDSLVTSGPGIAEERWKKSTNES